MDWPKQEPQRESDTKPQDSHDELRVQETRERPKEQTDKGDKDV